jgi:hypothetical protein
MKSSFVLPTFLSTSPALLFFEQGMAEVIQHMSCRIHVTPPAPAEPRTCYDNHSIRCEATNPIAASTHRELLHRTNDRSRKQVFDTFVADLKKEIRAEKTGLAAGNNFLVVTSPAWAQPRWRSLIQTHIWRLTGNRQISKRGLPLWTAGFLLLKQRPVTCFGLTNEGTRSLRYSSGYRIAILSGTTGTRRPPGG